MLPTTLPPITTEPARAQWTLKQREAWLRSRAARERHAAELLERAEVILERVAEFYGFRVLAMRSASQAPRLSEARHIACYLVRKLTGLTYHEIGPLFERTGSAISHACRDISRKLARWPGGSTALAIAQAEQVVRE